MPGFAASIISSLNSHRLRLKYGRKKTIIHAPRGISIKRMFSIDLWLGKNGHKNGIEAEHERGGDVGQRPRAFCFNDRP